MDQGLNFRPLVTNNFAIGTRAIGTTYQNGARTRIVIATISCGITVAGGSAVCYGSASNTNTGGHPNIFADVQMAVGIIPGALNEGSFAVLIFAVTPNQYYKLTASTTNGTIALADNGTNVSWIEIDI
jgi:hypothetical protein